MIHHVPIHGQFRGRGIYIKNRSTVNHSLMRRRPKRGGSLQRDNELEGVVAGIRDTDLNRNVPLEMARTQNKKHYQSLKFRL
jgi:hypothetical protein